MAKLTRVQVVLALGMLVAGSVTTLLKKAQNDCNVGYNFSAKAETVHPFNHPWFQTLFMFTGETLCLIVYVVYRFVETRKIKRLRDWISRNDVDESNTAPASFKPIQRPPIFHWIFIIPTCCDLVGTSLAGIGLVYVDASVWQMLCGSIIIFVGLLSMIFLKRRLRLVHWLGISLVVFGLVCVGVSDVFRQEKHLQSKSGWHTIVGIILIICSQLVAASQMIIEEIFLKKKGFHPMQVVGVEGLYGVILMAGIVLPAMYYIRPDGKPFEDSLDALYQVISSGKLLVLLFFYMCSIAFYDFFGMAVTKSLTAVHRTLIDALRTIFIWIVGLIVFYSGATKFGEQVTWWDFLQLDGFAFLVIGTAMYNGIMNFPCLAPANFAPEQIRDGQLLIDNGKGPSIQQESDDGSD